MPKAQRFIFHSLIVLAASLVGGLLGYLFQVAMGRMLGPNNYGGLLGLFSFFYLFSVPATALSTVITKYSAADNKYQQSLARVKKLLNRLSLLILLLLFLLTPLVVPFLQINSNLAWYLIILSMVISFLNTFRLAFLQGQLQFPVVALSSLAGAAVKLLSAVILVYLGLGIVGATAALVIANLLTFLYLDNRFRKQFLQTKPSGKPLPGRQKKELLDFALASFLFTAAFVALINLDVILARHFLSPVESGYYSALSSLGKVIYYVINPIVAVFFPFHLQGDSDQSNKIIKLATFIIIALCVSINFIYFLFPRFIILKTFGSSFLPAAANLGLFGLFISFYSLAYFLSFAIFSHKRFRLMPLIILAPLSQIALIYIFHQNISQIIRSSLSVSLALTVVLLFGLISKNEKSF